MDEIKEMVYDNNPYVVMLTFVVTMLHTIFQFLAVKNDIAYWRNLDSHKGISLRAIYSNFVIDLIVLLYLFDNDTSSIILISSVIEIVVSVWKILKTTKFQLREDGKFPYIKFVH